MQGIQNTLQQSVGSGQLANRLRQAGVPHLCALCGAFSYLFCFVWHLNKVMDFECTLGPLTYAEVLYMACYNSLEKT